jgi:hypothetical protein
MAPKKGSNNVDVDGSEAVAKEEMNRGQKMDADPMEDVSWSKVSGMVILSL